MGEGGLAVLAVWLKGAKGRRRDFRTLWYTPRLTRAAEREQGREAKRYEKEVYFVRLRSTGLYPFEYLAF